MKVSDFKEMIEREDFHPFVIKTKGGAFVPGPAFVEHLAAG
jgi:hypothetical protein